MHEYIVTYHKVENSTPMVAVFCGDSKEAVLKEISKDYEYVIPTGIANVEYAPVGGYVENVVGQYKWKVE